MRTIRLVKLINDFREGEKKEQKIGPSATQIDGQHRLDTRKSIFKKLLVKQKYGAAMGAAMPNNISFGTWLM
jgi:hypothetical protein